MIQKLRAENFKREYGILCHRFFPKVEAPTPFGATWCVVEPNGTTTPHDHFEGETFFIVDGRGLMTIEGRRSEVKQGDVVYIPPFAQHVLQNTSPTQTLTFVSLWWEKMPEAATPTVELKMPRTFITVAPPTPNGDLHLGHLAGPYLASDIYTRFLKMNQSETFFLSGSDDHQTYVPTKGKKLGLSPDEVVDRFSRNIRQTLSRAEVDLDYFVTPRRDADYVSFVQSFFKQLLETGKLEVKTASTLYCDTCAIYLWEAHVRGLCPHCTVPTNGNGCEACGRFNDCTDLKSPTCNHCDCAATVVTARRVFFPLNHYRATLDAYLKTTAMNTHLTAFTRNLLNDGLPEVSITNFAPWGIPVPVEGFEGQVIFDWFEMAAGYLYAAQQINETKDWRTLWKNPSSRIVQFFGFDNSFFYTTLIPALLYAYDSEVTLPVTFVSNEFYRLDGKKFSTSRNHAIWGDEILDPVGADVVRFYLSLTRPESEQTNFVYAEFKNTIDSVLVKQWEPWLISLQEKIDNAFSGQAPLTNPMSAKHRKFQNMLRQVTLEMTSHLEAPTFSLNGATRLLCRIVDESVRFSENSAYLENEPTLYGEWRTSVGLELTALKTLALLASPIMPNFSKVILESLGVNTLWDSQAALIEGDRPIGRFANRNFSQSLSAIETLERELSTKRI